MLRRTAARSILILLTALLAFAAGVLMCSAADEDIPVCSTVEDAGEALREAMKDRQEFIPVCIITDTAASDSGKLMGEIFETALQHTGEPDEGDYLRFQYESSKASAKHVRVQGSDAVLFTYAVTYYDSAEQEETAGSKAEEIISSLELEDKTDAEKVRAVYDYICRNAEYDYDGLSDQDQTIKYTAYGALVDGKAVCQGYCAALYRLLLEAGVDNRIIYGTGVSGDDSMDHTWNIVKLDGRYYNLDVTRDDELGDDWYYLRGSEMFDNDHFRSDEYMTDEFVSAYEISDEDYGDSSSGLLVRIGSFVSGAGFFFRRLFGTP